jgi:hypothetical protein
MISTSGWWRVITWFGMSLILINIFGPALGRIEGNIWPVVENTRIINVRDDGLTSTFDGDAHKIRDCNFTGIKWFVGQHDGPGRSEAQLLILERDKLRNPSPFAFGPWAIRLSEDDLRQNSFAEVYHNCHALFPTITRFYP